MERLYKKLESYGQSDYYPFHMPGHKRSFCPETLKNPYEIDITEIEGFDDLHHADGILEEGMARMANAVGALLGTLGMTDYYGAGVLTVFAFYLFRGRKWWCLLGQVLTLYWINVVLLGGLMYPIRLFGMEFELCQQGLALLALVPIWLYRGRQGCHSKPFQYACYAFYPVHMLLLVLALNLVNR